MNNVSGNRTSGSGDMSKSFARATANIEKAAEKVTNDFGGQASQKLDQGMTALQEGYDAAREKVEQGWEAAKSVASETENLIKRYPLAALACAAGVGWMVGKLINSRTHR